MRIQYDNLLDDASLTASSTATGYSADYLKDIHLSAKWRSTGDTSENIVVDLGSAMSVDSIAILGHNLTSGATLKIQGNDTDAWGAPSVDETITASADDIVHFFTSASHRYWRFTFADASNPDGYIEAGRLFVGGYTEVTKAMAKSFPEQYIDTSEQYFSESGQVFGVSGYRYRVYNFSFPYLSRTMVDTLKTILATVEKSTPIVLTLDEDNTDELPPCYCVIDSNLQLTHIHNFYFSGTLAFREVF